MTPEPDALIQAMIRHERAIADLYNAFARCFEQHGTLWKGLAQDEEHHAQWLERIAKALDAGRLVLKTPRFHPAAIDLSIHHIDQQRELALQGRLTPLEALSEAHSLETSLLERDFLDPFEAVDAESERVLSRLREATVQHGRQVEVVWAQSRQGGTP